MIKRNYCPSCPNIIGEDEIAAVKLYRNKREKKASLGPTSWVGVCICVGSGGESV